MSKQKSETEENGLPSEQEERIESNLKFCFKQEVSIVKGFYKGYGGVIEGYVHSKERQTTYYFVNLEVETKTVKIPESNLKTKLKFKIPFT